MSSYARNSMKKSICFIANIEFSIKAFLVDHFKAMLPIYDITVITNTDNVDFLRMMGLNIEVIHIPIERKIFLGRDIAALFKLYSLFKKKHFNALHSITPKSGLLSMVAGFLAGVPIRTHTFTGQVWATHRGYKRKILKAADKIIALCATHILVDSHSQRDFLIRENVVSKSSSHVIANGSMCGVDGERFAANPAARREVRQAHCIADSDFVFLFLGRLTRDKGLIDLAKAFKDLCAVYPNIHLVFVGPDEESMKSELISICSPYDARVHFKNYYDMPQNYMAASDVFCLPSYREGFGSVIIEAASTGVPSIGTRIYGLTDAIDDGQTGFLYEPGNIEELRNNMVVLLENRDLLTQMGMRARSRAMNNFSKDIIVAGMLDYYRKLFSGDNISDKY